LPLSSTVVQGAIFVSTTPPTGVPANTQRPCSLIYLVLGLHSICVNNGLTSSGHLSNERQQFKLTNRIPGLYSKLVIAGVAIRILLHYPILHPIPHRLHWVQIWRLRGPENRIDAAFVKIFFRFCRGVSRRAVLHQKECGIETHPAEVRYRVEYRG
jgi:hypothetical protein